MNKSILIGRLTSDPEVFNTQGDSKVAKYTLAVDRPFKKEGQQEADFPRCVCFGKNADFASRFLRKGIRIAVEGRIQTGSYTKDDGSKVYTTEIIVERHEFCESRKSSGDSGEQYESQGFQELDEDDGDLPF